MIDLIRSWHRAEQVFTDDDLVLFPADRGRDAWPDVGYEGEHLDLVFTNPVGGPILRQHVDRAITKAARPIGLDPSQFGTLVTAGARP